MKIEAIIRALPSEPVCQLPPLEFPKFGSGKVREIYDLGERILIIATDRISAFDVVLPAGIPGKGILLTQMSLFWFEKTAKLCENHLVPDHAEELHAVLENHPELEARSMLVEKLQPIPMEAVVRGYLSGSGWQGYRHTGKLFGQDVGSGLRESDRLPEPRFTPTSKATNGHDEPLSHAQSCDLIGTDRFQRIHQMSLRLYALGAEVALRAGLILADTKFEFGCDAEGREVLMDEIFTPDSSRLWPRNEFQPGRSQHAFDKQFVRDYLNTLAWDKSPPGPKLPDEVVRATQQRYVEALQRILASS